MKTSWRTTLGGIGAILSAVLHVITSLAEGKPVDITTVTVGISTGFALLAARDNKVTSEDVGVK